MRQSTVKRKADKRKKLEPEKIGNLKTQSAPVDTTNPYFSYDHAEGPGNRKDVSTYINMRESPAIWMFTHNLIDHAQLEAAHKFRRNYEGQSISRSGSVDLTKPIVDGGRLSYGWNGAATSAFEWLKLVSTILEENEYKVVESVCGKCLFISQLGYTEWQQRKQSKLLKDALDKIVDHEGFEAKTGVYWRDLRRV